MFLPGKDPPVILQPVQAWDVCSCAGLEGQSVRAGREFSLVPLGLAVPSVLLHLHECHRIWGGPGRAAVGAMDTCPAGNILRQWNSLHMYVLCWKHAETMELTAHVC